MPFFSYNEYANNRAVTWSYDADGRIKNDFETVSTYPARGMMAAFTSGNNSSTQEFDGDGQRVKTVKRYDATAPTDETMVTTTKIGYNQCGSLLWTKDTLNHQTTIEYTDAFAESVTGRNTFAYPTKVTDGDGFFSTVTYNFDLGAVVETKGPPAAGNTQGASTKTEYDDAGRVQKVTNLVNQAYTRYEYSPNGLDTKTYSTITENLGEAFSAVTSDGAGRPRISVADFPGTAAGHSRGRVRGLGYAWATDKGCVSRYHRLGSLFG